MEERRPRKEELAAHTSSPPATGPARSMSVAGEPVVLAMALLLLGPTPSGGRRAGKGCGSDCKTAWSDAE